MSQPSRDTPAHEPGLGAVELLCEQLGELGLPIGPDTARDILRAVLALEGPRMEAHARESLQISLDTIRVAAQSAIVKVSPAAQARSRSSASAIAYAVSSVARARVDRKSVV